MATDTESAAGAPELRHVSVLNSLGAEIVAGTLPVGTAVKLEELQARYGASRGLVRECMRILEGIGMLRSQRGMGVTVLPESSWNEYDPNVIRWKLEGPRRSEQLQILTELRLGLEPVAARLAALRTTQSEKDELRDVLALLRVNGEAGRRSRHLECDLHFHGLILRGAHNPMYSMMVPIVQEVLRSRRQFDSISHNEVLAAIERHERVGNAVIAGDEQEAEAAMHALLGEVRSSISTVATTGQ